MGLCQYVALCFHASSLPCLHTFWHAIPTSFYIYFLVIDFVGEGGIGEEREERGGIRREEALLDEP